MRRKSASDANAKGDRLKTYQTLWYGDRGEPALRASLRGLMTLADDYRVADQWLASGAPPGEVARDNMTVTLTPGQSRQHLDNLTWSGRNAGDGRWVEIDGRPYFECDRPLLREDAVARIASVIRLAQTVQNRMVEAGAHFFTLKHITVGLQTAYPLSVETWLKSPPASGYSIIAGIREHGIHHCWLGGDPEILAEAGEPVNEDEIENQQEEMLKDWFLGTPDQRQNPHQHPVAGRDRPLAGRAETA